MRSHGGDPFSKDDSCGNILGVRLGNGATAARLTLDQVILVRIQVPQPKSSKAGEPFGPPAFSSFFSYSPHHWQGTHMKS